MNNKAITYILKKYYQDYILLINDDAWIHKDFFQGFPKDGKYDVYIPKIYISEDLTKAKLSSFGVEYFKSGSVRNANNISLNTTLFSASCVLVRAPFVKHVINKYNYFFNPILRSYYEDIELGIRGLAIGAKYKKVTKMIAYHLGSFTSGKKSRYTIFMSYRNSLWVIVLCWPVKTIISNIFNIIIVLMWSFIYSSYRFGAFFYIKIIYLTIINTPLLVRERKNILSKYNSNFEFNRILSRYKFRTRGGVGF